MRNLPAKSSAERKERSEHDAPARASVAPENPILAARGQSFDGVGNRALLSLLRSGKLLRKARTSQPGDPREHEADRAPDAVVSSARPSSSRTRSTTILASGFLSDVRAATASIRSVRWHIEGMRGPAMPVVQKNGRFSSTQTE